MEKMKDAVGAIEEVNDIYMKAFNKNHTRDYEFFETINKEYDKFQEQRKKEKDAVDFIHARETPAYSEKARRFAHAMGKKYKEYSRLRWTFVLMMFIIVVLNFATSYIPGFQEFSLVPVCIFYISFFASIYWEIDASAKADKRWPCPKTKMRKPTKEEKKLYKSYFKHIWYDYVKQVYFSEVKETEELRKDLINALKENQILVEDYNRVARKYNKIVEVLTPEQMKQFKKLMETE